MPEKLDSTGRLLLDYVADIPANATEQCHEVFKAFLTLYRQGRGYTQWSIDAAIRSGNHRLLRWLMESGEAQFLLEGGVVVRDTLAPEKFTWCAVHSRNRFALRYATLRAEHFELVALEDDHAFLGYMRTCVWQPVLVEPISIAPFAAMLNGETEQGRLGFRWLLRHGMINTMNCYHQEQIAALYGDRARLLLSP
jgi:hypothetical protein